MSWILVFGEWFKIVPLPFGDEYKLVKPGERRQLVMNKNALRQAVCSHYGLNQ